MRRFGNSSFFRTFDYVVGLANPGLKLDRFVIDGITWTRERHSFAGQAYGFALDVFTGVCPGASGWTVTVVKEYWRGGGRSKSTKNIQWAAVHLGRKSDVMAWLTAQENILSHRQLR